jgi:hypothetical protein
MQEEKIYPSGDQGEKIGWWKRNERQMHQRGWHWHEDSHLEYEDRAKISDQQGVKVTIAGQPRVDRTTRRGQKQMYKET